VTGRHWTTTNIPEQSGLTAVITGGNTGLGFQVAQVLAGRGARVIIACRDRDKARRAVAEMATAARRAWVTHGLRDGREGPTPDVHVVQLDLASLGSVRDAAAELRSRFPMINLLVNNAGVMMTPQARTEDGFELQFGTNHLGHFALTGLLMEPLLAIPGARVVTVSSLLHRRGTMDFDADDRAYNRTAAYARSKLANLLFAYELSRRLTAAGAQAISLAAHPGYASTELTRNMPPLMRAGNRIGEPMLGQSAAQGALPLLRAATDPKAAGGQYYGPGNLLQTKGYPKLVRSSAQSYDENLARRLWEESEKLTGVAYPC
jgi:NAD(P)-dependent dehydrogenase (short-subunit alcohol dehydrogenase family)